MAADARMVAPKPASLTIKEAAALPLVRTTASFALLDRMAIPAGAKLPIQGGTGGFGAMALQLAAAGLDVELSATCRTAEKFRIAGGPGARKAFDCRTVTHEEMSAHATRGRGSTSFSTPWARPR